MRIIITGGRDHRPFTEAERGFLDRLHAQHTLEEVVTGGATGVDQEADKWAQSCGIDRVIFPANWVKHGHAAGPIRNQAMAAYLCSRNTSGLLCVAFPGGKGTGNMIATAVRHAIPVLCYPEGDATAEAQHLVPLVKAGKED